MQTWPQSEQSNTPPSLSYRSCKRLTDGSSGSQSLVSVVFDSTGQRLAVATRDGRVLVLVSACALDVRWDGCEMSILSNCRPTSSSDALFSRPANTHSLPCSHRTWVSCSRHTQQHLSTPHVLRSQHPTCTCVPSFKSTARCSVLQTCHLSLEHILLVRAVRGGRQTERRGKVSQAAQGVSRCKKR